MRFGISLGFGPFRIYQTLWKTRGRKPKYWTHPGCSVHHTREDTANRHADAMARKKAAEAAMQDFTES